MADLIQILQVGGDASSIGILVFLWSMHNRLSRLERKTFGF